MTGSRSLPTIHDTNSAANTLSCLPHPAPSTPDNIIEAKHHVMVAAKVDTSITDAIRVAYMSDELFAPVITNPE